VGGSDDNHRCRGDGIGETATLGRGAKVKLECWVYEKEAKDDSPWKRWVVFPFPPFPGMKVASFTVKKVLVCQGDLDGEGHTYVLFKPVETGDAVLISGGWSKTLEGGVVG
jgi:hypothetical protein